MRDLSMIQKQRKEASLWQTIGCIAATIFCVGIIGATCYGMAVLTRYVLGIFHYNVTLWQAFWVWFLISCIFGAAKSTGGKKD